MGKDMFLICPRSVGKLMLSLGTVQLMFLISDVFEQHYC